VGFIRRTSCAESPGHTCASARPTGRRPTPKSASSREALINAVIHRDYSIAGDCIRFFMFDDRIEFYSPGDLLPGVTVEKMQRLEGQSKLRNPVVVEVFHDLDGFIEKPALSEANVMGTGVQRMARAMEEHGSAIPRFEELGGEFRLTLIGPGERFMEKASVSCGCGRCRNVWRSY